MKNKIELKSTRVLRSGRTARHWQDGTSRVALGFEARKVVLTFSLPSKGGGITEICVEIGTDDFAALISRMVSAERTVALCELSSTLAAEMAHQTEYDRRIAAEARNSVTDAAEEAFDGAPSGRDHAERLTRDVVRTLVAELNKKATLASGPAAFPD